MFSCDMCVCTHVFSSTENVVQNARILSPISTQPSRVKIYTVSLRPAFSIRDRDSSKPFLSLRSSFFPSKAQDRVKGKGLTTQQELNRRS